ncbi:differentially expressed in FDCP 6-like isoform X2 [Lepisosteus oculatus]|uniref:differentially expressed in FDCP 6-like isoform X2 n=1 Tax=Lepisosteus oculatus TaxID=7918 RepID=UPI00371324A1
MNFKAELLKSIWYAFTSLDVEQSGKVSKSQLKVLSHNLYTALNIPHDPVALEEHFRDDDAGPVSNQGYMPYLNNYILAKAREGTFNKEAFDDLCWMMTSKKNYDTNKLGILSSRDCFRLFCLFNLLSEDTYPLVMIPDEVEYLLKKIAGAMSLEWNRQELDAFYSLKAEFLEGMSVWTFLEQVNSGKLLHVESIESFSLALDEVFQEMYHNVLKKGYMWKKGHMRRNWNERWFVLKPAGILYYVSEDMKERKGEIPLDKTCVVESIPDREGKRCLFCVKAATRSYEISASDQKQRLEWVQAIQTAVRLQAEGKTSLHRELKLRRREQRQQSPHAREEPPGLQVLQEERGRQELEQEQLVRQEQERRLQEEQERKRQLEVQRSLERQLEEAERVRESMAAEIARKEQEARGQRRRIEELELTQQSLERALNAEIQARLEEETARLEQERLLSQEEEKLQHLSLLKQEQDLLLQQAQLERSMLEAEVADKVQAFETASQELQRLRESRERSNHDLQVAQKKLRRASRHVKHWNVQLNRLMQPIAPGDQRQQAQSRDPGTLGRRGALSSKEFIARRCPGNRPVSECSSSSEDEGLEEDLQKISLSGANRRRMEPNGQEH